MTGKSWLLYPLCLSLSACVSQTPHHVDNICHIFRQHPRWETHATDVASRWKVPVPVQMAIVHQESKFDANAKPPRRKLLGFIPWDRPSTAEGYAQALRSTWANYKQTNGGFWSSRHDFADSLDFIGWYADEANRRARIPRYDAYRLYLAYHEGIGGFERKTYLHKPWLVRVAQKVKARAATYEQQWQTCRR